MRKFSKLALSVLLCAAMTVSTGCSLTDKVSDLFKKEKSSSDYVTLGKYDSISLKKSEVDEKVQAQIDETLDEYSDYKKLKKGKVKKGDTVNIYYVGRMNGKKFDGGSCTKKTNPAGFDLTIGSNSFIEGFEDGLIGASVGDTVKVKTTFPDPYPNNPDYANKKAEFTVTINYLRGDKVIPELDDEFVTTNLTAYKSVDEYKSTLRSHSTEDMAWDAVYEASEVKEYPQDKVDAMYDQLYTSIVYYLQQNNYQLSDYLSAQNATSEDFKKQLQDTAKEDVGKQLVYGAIAEKENLAVTEKEYQSELKDYLSTYNCEDEEALNKLFQNYYGTDAQTIIMDDLLFKKVKSFLAENVKEA